MPQPGGITNQLRSVCVVATDDVWAVGMQSDRRSGERVLIEHWGGRRWQVVPAPSPGKTQNTLMSVDARNAFDVWAVGSAANGSSYDTLVEHWNGGEWRRVPSPPHSAEPTLEGVSALAADDVWSVGNVISEDGRLRAVAERWDGHRWRKRGPHWR